MTIPRRHHIPPELLVRRLESTRWRVAAPDSIWPVIAARIRTGETLARARRSWFQPHLALVIPACIVGFLVLRAEWWRPRQAATKPTLEVGRYLSDLERSDSGPSQENLRNDFGEFTMFDRTVALKETGLGPEVGSYRLVDERISRSSPRVVQLVYDSGSDIFAVFVAPRSTFVNFGDYRLSAADVGGIRCRRVECPRQDVYFAEGDQQYVFVRRHGNAGDSERLFASLLEGHVSAAPR